MSNVFPFLEQKLNTDMALLIYGHAHAQIAKDIEDISEKHQVLRQHMDSAEQALVRTIRSNRRLACFYRNFDIVRKMSLEKERSTFEVVLGRARAVLGETKGDPASWDRLNGAFMEAQAASQGLYDREMQYFYSFLDLFMAWQERYRT